jgi:16S rRNA (uracil1498-N3)-methyltransferase
MQHRRFYVPRNSIQNNSATLPSGQAHHLRDVLRIKTGEVVEIFDGAGHGYAGIVELQGSEVLIRNLQSLPAQESLTRIILAAALIKSSKFEWVLQKAAELGVDEFIPLKTGRSDVRIPDSRISSRTERWNRIVQEASKQCRRLSAPRIHPLLSFSEFLFAEGFCSCTKLLFHSNAADTWKLDPDTASRQILLCIGPEGGWEDSEIEHAVEAGYQIFSLGPWVMRAETAAIAAVSITQYHINLWNRQH